ncbi:hypothetical protein A8M60_07575 [Nocardia farcinica]|nr:hypothetical protein A8M60_07575 [Nocardia farcinica]
MSESFVWFFALSIDTQASLIVDPRKSLTADEIVTLGRHNKVQSTGYFVSNPDSSPTFQLTEDARAEILKRREQRRQWWDQLSNETQSVLIERAGENVPAAHRDDALVPGVAFLTEVSDGQGISGEPFSLDPFTCAFIRSLSI